jgi:enamine deaminase RidA (YjgF/YER057c/UK114 family)
VRVGEFLFPSGLMALGTDGRIAGAAVSSTLDGLAHGGYAQAATIYAYVEKLCAAVGTSAANIVRAQYFMADIRDFAGVAAAWTGRYGAQPHPFVCVEVPAPLPAPGAALIGDFWIYIPS